MRAHTYTSRRHRQHGVALIEAMIAILLFSFGVLALAGIQAVMSKNITQSKLRGEATLLANQLIGQMWVDQANLASYVIDDDACTVSTYTKCTAWLASVRQVLPGGGAEVTVNAGVVGITLNWALPGEYSASQLQIDANITN